MDLIREFTSYFGPVLLGLIVLVVVISALDRHRKRGKHESAPDTTGQAEPANPPDGNGGDGPR